MGNDWMTVMVAIVGLLSNLLLYLKSEADKKILARETIIKALQEKDFGFHTEIQELKVMVQGLRTEWDEQMPSLRASIDSIGVLSRKLEALEDQLDKGEL